MPPTEEAYKKSIRLLHTLATDDGFLASRENVENYDRVWARDGVVAGIAALLSKDSVLIETFKQTLLTLEAHQDETGRIPSNIVPKTGRTSYGTTVGRIDATLWYIIGVTSIAKIDNDKKFFTDHKESVERALFYLDCLELNGRGLLYIPQGGDWADEYINHGYVLFDEMLYYFALSSFVSITNDRTATTKRDRLRELIRINYFPSHEGCGSPYVYHKALYNHTAQHYVPPMPAAYFTNHSIRFHTDTFAISLLLLSDVIDQDDSDLIRTYVRATCIHSSFPILPAFHPVIKKGDIGWEHLQLNFLYEFRNKPNQYHNGGLWPLVHGFFLASFSHQDEGRLHLDTFATVLARDNYLFPEYYHGETFEPLGTKYLGFSAAAYIIAYESIVHKKNIFTLLTT